MKIGILGGSFDPIHNGHLYMAKQIQKEFHLDQILLMPAGHSPNKHESKMAPANLRLEMARIAATDFPEIYASDLEVMSEEISYTYRTMQKLKEAYPNDELYFIMGADSLDYFDKWYHPEIICQLATILVVNRSDFTNEDLYVKIQQIKCLFPANIYIAHCDKYNISSSELRDRIRNNEDISKFLPKAVLSFINEHHLYRG